MSCARVDQMIERAAEVMCSAQGDLDGLPQQLACEWPDAPALELTVALASAAGGVQTLLGGDGHSGGRAQIGWQLAALVAAETHFLTITGQPHETAGDLLAHWAREKAGV